MFFQQDPEKQLLMIPLAILYNFLFKRPFLIGTESVLTLQATLISYMDSQASCFDELLSLIAKNLALATSHVLFPPDCSGR